MNVHLSFLTAQKLMKLFQLYYRKTRVTSYLRYDQACQEIILSPMACSRGIRISNSMEIWPFGSHCKNVRLTMEACRSFPIYQHIFHTKKYRNKVALIIFHLPIFQHSKAKPFVLTKGMLFASIRRHHTLQTSIKAAKLGGPLFSGLNSQRSCYSQ